MSSNKVIDRRPILKVNVFRSSDFIAAVNCNFDLYTGFSNREEMKKRAKEAFSKGQNYTLKKTLSKKR